MRTIIARDPEGAHAQYGFESSAWPARWIGHAQHAGQRPVVLAFHLHFGVGRPTEARIHVAADERYELFLDGVRVGRGNERGDERNWFYETYDISVPAGAHHLVARVWWLGKNGPSPLAQAGESPAFLLFGEGDAANSLLSTGVADWSVMEMAGYRFVAPQAAGFTAVGARTDIDGNAFPWGFENGSGGGWAKAPVVAVPRIKALFWETDNRQLRPAILPAMAERRRHAGVARHVMNMPRLDPAHACPNGPAINRAENVASAQQQWNAMLRGEAPVTVPAHTCLRVLIDLQNYYCAYGELITTGGRGATVRTLWAESLYLPPGRAPFPKGNRDEIEGKVFMGMGSTFTLDGGLKRSYAPLWWDAGRYVAVDVQTRDEPVTIEAYTLLETGYPFAFTATFEASDERLKNVIPTALRTLSTCAHETYMDCPYYEQLMYVGDTRLEALVTYATTADDRLPRKAIELFDLSRDTDGFTSSRYPTRTTQRIPTFSMLWVGMVHDYAHWRNDTPFVRDRMAGVRAVGEAVRRYIDPSTGLLNTPPGWNFVDWVPSWERGIPPGGDFGFKGSVNWQAALMFRQAADLETLLGEPLLAQRNAAAADQLVEAIGLHFYDAARGLFAEDLEKSRFSEHSQSLALLEGSILSDAGRRNRLAAALLEDASLDRTTIYFTHYLFEAYRVLGRTDRILDRMGLWFDLPGNGFRTTPETPEPSRSDCHAWGAHPVLHYFATILGIRPAGPAFATVRVTPRLGPLDWARGTMPHPAGEIAVDVRKERGFITGHIDLPAGVGGALVLPTGETLLKAGRNSF